MQPAVSRLVSINRSLGYRADAAIEALIQRSTLVVQSLRVSLYRFCREQSLFIFFLESSYWRGRCLPFMIWLLHGNRCAVTAVWCCHRAAAPYNLHHPQLQFTCIVWKMTLCPDDCIIIILSFLSILSLVSLYLRHCSRYLILSQLPAESQLTRWLCLFLLRLLHHHF